MEKEMLNEMKNSVLWLNVALIFAIIASTILFLLVIGLINRPQIDEKKLIASCQTINYYYINEDIQIKCEVLKK
jgi:hypothetical protein